MNINIIAANVINKLKDKNELTEKQLIQIVWTSLYTIQEFMKFRDEEMAKKILNVFEQETTNDN